VYDTENIKDYAEFQNERIAIKNNPCFAVLGRFRTFVARKFFDL
jgi:hypothetical protein